MDFKQISACLFTDLGPIVAEGSAGANLAWNHRNGEVGITAALPFRSFVGNNAEPVDAIWEQIRCGIDFQHTFKSVVCYGEFAKTDTSYAMVAGTRFPIRDTDLGIRLSADRHEKNVTAALCRLSDSRVHGIDFGASFSRFTTAKGETPDGGMQFKLVGTYKASIPCGLVATSRVSARFRNWGEWRKIDLRQDLGWGNGAFIVNTRINALLCKSLAGLTYAETGYRTEKLSCYLQCGAFLADNWDDRLYVYQRDVPQSFNVSAIYGRGYWISAFITAKAGRHFKFYLKTGWTSYPWARPGDTRQSASLSAKVMASATF